MIVSTAAFLGYGTGTDLGYLTGDVIQKTITEQKKGPTKNLNTHGHGFENSVLSDTNLKQKIGYGSVQQSANQKTKQFNPNLFPADKETKYKTGVKLNSSVVDP